MLRAATEWGSKGLSKLVISRVISRVTPFRALITLLITYLLSLLPLQEGFGTWHFSAKQGQIVPVKTLMPGG